MPPKRKFNKQRQVALKKQLTKRLMAISLLVEKYIYKNKQITVVQAQIHLQELISLKPQCLGDAPSLQVCEKLTRCMKGIIEEQSNHAQDTLSFMEPNQLAYPNTPSPVYSLPDEDKTQMLSEPGAYEDENLQSIISQNKDTNREKKAVRFSMDVDINSKSPEQKSDETSKNNADNHNPHIIITNQDCNIDDELTDVILDLTLEDIEQPTINEDLYSQSLLKNMEAVETIDNVEECLTNNNCGQDMDEFDREVVKLIEHESQNCVNNNKERASPETIPIVMHQQNILAPVNKIAHGNSTVSQTVNKATPCITPVTNEILSKYKAMKNTKPKKKVTKKKNKENIAATKRKIKTDSKITKKDTSRLVFTPLTKHSEETQQHALTNPYNKTITESTNIIKDAVNFSEVANENSSNAMETSKPTNKIPEIDRLSHFINSTTTKNIVCFEEDLSWMENIKYVRKIHLEEYDSTFKPLSDSFWDNCELPHYWDNRDFEL